jgi:hypothetical protein
MKRLFGLVIVLGALTAVWTGAEAQTLADIGTGAHGYDVLIGTWNCSDALAPAGQGATTLTVAASGAAGSLGFRVNGTGYSIVGFIAYDPKTKTWLNPVAYFDGGSSLESTTQTGPKSVWTGTGTGPMMGMQTVQMRDSYVFTSMTQYTDLFEVNANGTWTPRGNLTCNKAG